MFSYFTTNFHACLSSLRAFEEEMFYKVAQCFPPMLEIVQNCEIPYTLCHQKRDSIFQVPTSVRVYFYWT